jgi:alkylated DNA nucleotide flippase Atl1
VLPADALGRFLSQLAAAAQQLAADLQGVEEPVDPEAPLVATLGRRQRAAYEAIVAANGSIATGQVATSIAYDFSNTYMTLRRLEQLRLVEMVPGARPQRWKLRHHESEVSTRYRVGAAQVRKGEWATYGDISIAVRGDDKGAIAVGRLAATQPRFPNPHRILRAGGVIPRDWHIDDGGGPERCRELLAGEGVAFDRHGRADPARRVSWEEIRERARSAGVTVRAPGDA